VKELEAEIEKLQQENLRLRAILADALKMKGLPSNYISATVSQAVAASNQAISSGSSSKVNLTPTVPKKPVPSRRSRASFNVGTTQMKRKQSLRPSLQASNVIDMIKKAESVVISSKTSSRSRFDETEDAYQRVTTSRPQSKISTKSGKLDDSNKEMSGLQKLLQNSGITDQQSYETPERSISTKQGKSPDLNSNTDDQMDNISIGFTLASTISSKTSSRSRFDDTEDAYQRLSRAHSFTESNFPAFQYPISEVLHLHILRIA
jgi:hypothetical protein